MVFFYAASGWFFVDAFETAGAAAREEAFEQPLASAATLFDDPWAAGRQVGRELGLRGRLDSVEETPDGVTLSFRRPGLHVDVAVARGADSAQVTRRSLGTAGSIRALHAQRHARGGVVYVAWALLADATALALLVFAVTGAILSWREDRGRALRWGGAFTVLTVAMILYLRILP